MAARKISGHYSVEHFLGRQTPPPVTVVTIASSSA
jgi:hypothetical protein